jgi:hypothetical protein
LCWPLGARVNPVPIGSFLIVLALPYLPMKKPVRFSGWVVGPLESADGRWSDKAFEARAKEFFSKFRTVDGKPVERPSIAFRADAGVDGATPEFRDWQALGLALTFAVLDGNPPYGEDVDGHWISTADNADLWVQPINVSAGSIALGRGLLVSVTGGGWTTADPTFFIPAPLELSIPLSTRVDPEIAGAIFDVASGKHDTTDAALAGRITTAVRLHAKAWRNTTSFGFEDRVVVLRTAFEALTDASKGPQARARLELIFRRLRRVGVRTDADVEHLLWKPSERPVRPFTFVGSGGQPVTEPLTDLGHWFAVFGAARHQIVHEGGAPSLMYRERGSAYTGPMFHVGERVLREAVRAALVVFGYDDLWAEMGYRAITRRFAQAEAYGEILRALDGYARRGTVETSIRRAAGR